MGADGVVHISLHVLVHQLFWVITAMLSRRSRGQVISYVSLSDTCPLARSSFTSACDCASVWIMLDDVYPMLSAKAVPPAWQTPTSRLDPPRLAPPPAPPSPAQRRRPDHTPSRLAELHRCWDEHVATACLGATTWSCETPTSGSRTSTMTQSTAHESVILHVMAA